MAKLEYRLYGLGDSFPLLYYYESIPEEEVALRFACDYFVKDGTVYEKTSAAVEPVCCVIYVKEADDEQALRESGSGAAGGGVRIELREFAEEAAVYRIVEEYSFRDSRQALLYILSDFLYAENAEWNKTSAEIDEDRKVYVIYAQRTGEEPQ